MFEKRNIDITYEMDPFKSTSGVWKNGYISSEINRFKSASCVWKKKSCTSNDMDQFISASGRKEGK